MGRLSHVSDSVGSFAPSTPAMIGGYQGVIVAVLLPFGLFDVNAAPAYALLVFGVQLVVWIILGIWGLSRTGIKIKALSSGIFERKTRVIVK